MCSVCDERLDTKCTEVYKQSGATFKTHKSSRLKRKLILVRQSKQILNFLFVFCSSGFMRLYERDTLHRNHCGFYSRKYQWITSLTL